MKLSKTTFLASLALSALALTANAEMDKAATEGAEAGKWTQDLEAAKKLAGETKLPLLVNFTGSDWCHWCKIMDKQVFAKEEWKTFAAKNAVLVTIDFPNDKSIVPQKYVARNKALQEQFRVQGYPTYVILDSDGETQIGQLSAGKDKTPKSFIVEFKESVQMSARAIEAYMKANPDKADAFKAAIDEGKMATKEFSAWIATEPEKNEENMAKFATFQKRIQMAREKMAQF